MKKRLTLSLNQELSTNLLKTKTAWKIQVYFFRRYSGGVGKGNVILRPGSKVTRGGTPDIFSDAPSVHSTLYS